MFVIENFYYKHNMKVSIILIAIYKIISQIKMNNYINILIRCQTSCK